MDIEGAIAQKQEHELRRFYIIGTVILSTLITLLLFSCNQTPAHALMIESLVNGPQGGPFKDLNTGRGWQWTGRDFSYNQIEAMYQGTSYHIADVYDMAELQRAILLSEVFDEPDIVSGRALMITGSTAFGYGVYGYYDVADPYGYGLAGFSYGDTAWREMGTRGSELYNPKDRVDEHFGAWIVENRTDEQIAAYSTPEPATMALLGSGLVGLLFKRRKAKI